MSRFAAALLVALASLAATAADPAVAALARLDQAAAPSIALAPAAGAPVDSSGSSFVISAAPGGSVPSGVVVINRTTQPVTVQLHAATATIDDSGAVQLAPAPDPSLDAA